MVAVFKRRVKESTVENSFIRKCRNYEQPLKLRKMNGEGNRSWPDRMILGSQGFTAFIEFKRPGEKPTELQSEMLQELGQLGFPASWFDDATRAFDWLTHQYTCHLSLVSDRKGRRGK